jgi:uncharacterized protein (DUF2336 family)
MTADLALIQEVANAVANGAVSQRSEMVRRVTDLFIVGLAQYSDEEVTLFDDVFTRLAVQIEISARALLAVRLAPIPKAPPNIIRALAFDDEIDVAGPVLAQSERLDDPTLVENARKKGQEHLFAISRRRSLSEPVTDELVERGDQLVVLSTAANRGAKFSNAGFEILVRRSDGDDSLASCVGSRPEIPPQLFLKLLAKASQAVRAKLEAEHPDARHEVHQAVSEVTSRIQAESFAEPLDYGAAQISVEMLHRSGKSDDSKLRVLANAGHFAEITEALALMCELPRPFVERAMNQERSDTLLVLAKAAELSWSTVRTILSLRARKRGVSAREIAQCLASFERLKPAAAKEIVQFYRRREQTKSTQSV